MRPGLMGEGGGEAGIDGRALWQVRKDVVRLGLMGASAVGVWAPLQSHLHNSAFVAS